MIDSTNSRSNKYHINLVKCIIDITMPYGQ